MSAVPPLGRSLHQLLAAILGVLCLIEVLYYLRHLRHCHLIRDAVRADDDCAIVILIALNNSGRGTGNDSTIFRQTVTQTSRHRESRLPHGLAPDPHRPDLLPSDITDVLVKQPIALNDPLALTIEVRFMINRNLLTHKLVALLPDHHHRRITGVRYNEVVLLHQ